MQSNTACYTTCLLTIITWWGLFTVSGSESDPQLNLLNSGCSQYNVSNFQDFSSNLNATWIQLREQLNSNKYFATAQQAKGSDPAYAMVQCRNYLSSADCLACFETALTRIRNCSAANGGRVIYDGCFLRVQCSNAGLIVPCARLIAQETMFWHKQSCGGNNVHINSIFVYFLLVFMLFNIFILS